MTTDPKITLIGEDDSDLCGPDGCALPQDAGKKRSRAKDADPKDSGAAPAEPEIC